MACLTNNHSRYIEQIEKELIQSCDAFEVCYVEMCSLLTYAYAIVFNTKHQTLALRLWNAEADNIRFRLGIFDLECLSVSSRDIHLDKHSRERLLSLADAQFTVQRVDSVVIDGAICQLLKDTTHLKWKMSNQMNRHLKELVQQLKSNASLS